MRLDKYISHATGLSRTASRRAIKNAAVQINGETVKSAQTEVGDADQVSLEGEALALPGHQYWMLNKPAGYVSASQDSEHPTVLDLLSELPIAVTRELSVAGRLDKDTTGLVLLSNDGSWIHRLTSPRHEHPKTYLTQLERAVTPSDIEQFAAGILLHSESKATRPAQLRALPEQCAEITINEGRYHQIKRMFAATGNHVVALHRISIGAIQLDPELAPGQYRPLTDDEIGSAQ